MASRINQAFGLIDTMRRARRLFVVGRDDEMIVSGGENVYPIEVEKTLAAHPEVAEAAVIGVDDEQYGQRLAAFVVLEPSSSATPGTLKILRAELQPRVNG
jgi:acyl-CoA synthetase (AMP-forming)/AMP-acid ligase II